MKEPSTIKRFLYRIALPMTAAFLIYHYWPTDIARVENNTRKMIAAINKTGNESLPVAAARSLDAVSYLASNVVLNLGEPFPSSLRKSEITPMLQHARMQATKLALKSLGHQAEQKPDGSIWIDITLDAEVESSGMRDQLLGNYRLIWQERDGDWKLTGAENIEVIKHPSGTAYPF